MAEEQDKDMSVSEAGHKGGQRVRELIDEGKEVEGEARTTEEDDSEE